MAGGALPRRPLYVGSPMRLAGLLLVLAAAAAVLTGAAIQRWLVPGAAAPVTMRSVTPGGLDRMGIHLWSPHVPPECFASGWRPLRLVLSECPLAQDQAEWAARGALAAHPGSPGPRAVETVLAQADVPVQFTRGAGIHQLAWVVAVDQQAAYAPLCVKARPVDAEAPAAGC